MELSPTNGFGAHPTLDRPHASKLKSWTPAVPHGANAATVAGGQEAAAAKPS